MTSRVRAQQQPPGRPLGTGLQVDAHVSWTVLLQGCVLAKEAGVPTPFLRASPSFLVPAKSNMTLRCWTPVRNVEFTFSKGRILLPSKSMVSVDHSGRMAEVPLVNLSRQDSGKYTCKYCRTEAPRQCSPARDVLLVKRLTVTPAENVTLQCQKTDLEIAFIMWALLKRGIPEPIDVPKTIRERGSPHLRRVRDGGSYR
ncbi:hypothetical protein GH733_017257, partial [Mirounga leonina]